MLDKLRHRLQMRRLLKELANEGAKSPKLEHTIRMERNNGAYDPATHKVIIAPDIDRKQEEAILAHELAHATGLIGTRGNKATKAIGTASAVISNNRGLDALIQISGGTPISVAAHLARIAEESQANVRGHKALKKIKKGKLTDHEKATFINSMSSYMIGLPVSAIVPPKAVQIFADKMHPGFANEHKVLYDYIAEAVND